MLAGVAWFAAFLALAYAYWVVMSTFVIRDFWDTGYAWKLELLKARMKEHPGRPVWLLFGSSHVDDGLAADTLTDKINDGKSPLLFNFGTPGSDLFFQFIWLRRTLNAGIAPARVGVEFDMLLNNNDSDFAENPALIPRARRQELAEFCAHSDKPATTRDIWLQSRLNPFFEHGMRAPQQALTLRLLPFLSHMERQYNSNWGWLQIKSPHPPQAQFDAMIGRFAHYTDRVKQPIPPSADRTLHAIIDLCREYKTSLFLIRMPEGAVARNDSPEALGKIQTYLDKLSRDENIQVIDARSWVPDDGLFDPHHLNVQGAIQFTKKLADVLYSGDGK